MTASAGLAGWLGKTRTEDDLLIPGPARRLLATLDRDPAALSEGADLPPLFHWLYFLGETQVQHLARDGNPFAALGEAKTAKTKIDWGVYGAPETFIIDAEGRVVMRWAGPITQRVLKETILPALEEAKRGGEG